MEFLSRTIAQIKTQLGMLTGSQKLVCLLLVVIIIGASVWMVRYSADREMVPLFNESLSESQLRPVISKLERWGVEYELNGDVILVPKVELRTISNRLYYADVLPGDTTMGFGALLENGDIFSTPSQQDDKRWVILQSQLGVMITRLPGVEKARVIINMGSKRTISNISPLPSATVVVTLRGSSGATRKLATTIAAMVATGVNRLRQENVTVVISGKRFPIAPAGEDLNGEYLERKASHERQARQKILAALDIPNTLVQVDVTPRISKTSTNRKEYLPDRDGSLTLTVAEKSREDTANSSVERKEPGVLANVAESRDSGSGGTSTESTETDVMMQGFAGQEETYKETPAGGIIGITATVRIPRSYFAAIVKSESGSDEPTREMIQETIAREMPGLKKAVMLAIGLRGTDAESRVDVTDYPDVAMAASAGLATAEISGSGAAAAAPSVVSVANQYGKQIAVGVLAVISLLMMLMMVKKAGGAIETPEEEVTLMMGDKPLDALSLEESNIDGDDASSGLLAGVELDEEVVRSQQILEQVRNMVEESPESAASLMGKWILQER